MTRSDDKLITVTTGPELSEVSKFLSNIQTYNIADDGNIFVVYPDGCLIPALSRNYSNEMNSIVSYLLKNIGNLYYSPLDKNQFDDSLWRSTEWPDVYRASDKASTDDLQNDLKDSGWILFKSDNPAETRNNIQDFFSGVLENKTGPDELHKFFCGIDSRFFIAVNDAKSYLIAGSVEHDSTIEKYQAEYGRPGDNLNKLNDMIMTGMFSEKVIETVISNKLWIVTGGNRTQMSHSKTNLIRYLLKQPETSYLHTSFARFDEKISFYKTTDPLTGLIYSDCDPESLLNEMLIQDSVLYKSSDPVNEVYKLPLLRNSKSLTEKNLDKLNDIVENKNVRLFIDSYGDGHYWIIGDFR